MSVLDGHPKTVAEQTVESRTSSARANYWLEHSDGFQVFGPDGRIGFVALVLSSDNGVDGLVVRTGLLRTRSVFVPLHEVGSVLPRRRRLELLVAPRVPRARVSDLIRELVNPAAEPFPLRRDETASVPVASTAGAER